MVEFIVNMTLFVALLVLLVVWAMSVSRRRRRDRREHARDRRLILGAITAAAGGGRANQAVNADGDNYSQVEFDVSSADHARLQHSSRTSARQFTTTPAQQLDPDSIIALLDLLENRKLARRGLFASLFTSPGSVWSAGIRAGQNIFGTTMSARGVRGQTEAPIGAQLYREAASELVNIYTYNPANAPALYITYAAAIGDPALAELFVWSAVSAAYADQSIVAQTVAEIVGVGS